jgi:RNA polymerase sigma-70 factor, ECF subfamily
MDSPSIPASSALSSWVVRNLPRWVESLKAARTQWPGVQISDEVFVDYVAERLPPDLDSPDAELLLRNAQDLFLACACAHGDGVALRALEDAYFADEVDAPTRRSGAVSPEEMRQQVRAKLFVGPSPKIASYAGRSSLRTWLRAVIGRLVIDAARARPRDVPAPTADFLDLACASDDPDRRLLKQTYRGALEEAFTVAASRLSPKDRNLLRYGLSEGLNIDQIGRIYGVHRVTAHRWLQKARATFAENIQAAMTERLKMSPSEFDSVLNLVMSQIDVTIARVFSE